MSSTAVTAIFIPVALRIAHSSGSSPSKLMMPISFAALISGMLTLVATAPNLVVNSELVRHFHGDAAKGFQFFSFTPFGLPILVLGVGYMIFARRLLPDRLDRRVQAGRQGVSAASDGAILPRRQDSPGDEPPSLLRCKYPGYRTSSQILTGIDPSQRPD